MSNEEEKKYSCGCRQNNGWLKILLCILGIFLATFLAFYLALTIMLHRFMNPMYNADQIEKIMAKQEREFNKMEKRIMNNPFEPKLRPMFVNFADENHEYKIVVDLKPFDGNEKALKVDYNNKMLTVFGEMDKKSKNNENIVKFSQSYYLDDDVDISKMTKEKIGDNYIITIPQKED